VSLGSASAWRGKRGACWLAAALAIFTLLWDGSPLDLWVMRQIGDANGFAWRDHWLLSKVLHDAMHQLALLAYGLTLMSIWWPLGPWRRLRRSQRLEAFCGITLCVLLIAGLKVFSHTSCPWDLQEFGGSARYLSHWTWGGIDGGPEHCFPAGHVSSVFSFFALALPWLAGDASERRFGRRILLGVLVLGALLGLGQTLRGAHFPSHTLWTALICWVVALLNHALFKRLPVARFENRQG
jgi:membrane-associated PAP2 superfamily phosphatase